MKYNTILVAIFLSVRCLASDYENPIKFDQIKTPDFDHFKELVGRNKADLGRLLDSVLRYAENRIGKDAEAFGEAMRHQGCNVWEDVPAGKMRIVIDPYLRVFGMIHSLEITCDQHPPEHELVIEVHLVAHPNMAFGKWIESPIGSDSLWRWVRRTSGEGDLQRNMPLLRTELSLGKTNFGFSEPEAYAYAYTFELRVIDHSYPATTRSRIFKGYSGLREMFYGRKAFERENRVLRRQAYELKPEIHGPDGGIYEF